MRNYLYIDKVALSLFYQQLDDVKPKKRRKTVGLSLAGPRVDVTEEDDLGVLPHQMIEGLMAGLEKQGLLTTTRPKKTYEENACRFVLETVDAIKVVLPRAVVSTATGVDRNLAIWVADPDIADIDSDVEANELVWRAQGTFLYLTEARLDDGDFQTTYSGCSALQAIVNVANGRRLIGGQSGEPLGRGSYDHPIAKLVNLGGTTSGEIRRIQSLYYIRYMTDEQHYMHGSQLLRGHDLLGYPVFIAD